jgi:hypothetical protein
MSESGRHGDCPGCGTAHEPLQEYCLECGARLPANRGVVGFLAGEWQRHFAWYPGDWIWPVLFLFVLTVVATAAAVAAGSSGSPSARQTIVGTTGVPQRTVSTTVSTSTATTTPTTTTTKTVTIPAPSPNAPAGWPAGKSGYTAILLSLPADVSRQDAATRAQAAKRAGLPHVGVLDSSEYSSLRPGYLVVFSGVYASPAAASAAVTEARAHGFPDAYQRRVSR